MKTSLIGQCRIGPREAGLILDGLHVLKGLLDLATKTVITTSGSTYTSERATMSSTSFVNPAILSDNLRHIERFRCDGGLWLFECRSQQCC